MKKKIIALVLVLALVVNITLFALKLTNHLVFWSVIIGIALITYFGFSKSKK